MPIEPDIRLNFELEKQVLSVNIYKMRNATFKSILYSLFFIGMILAPVQWVYSQSEPAEFTQRHALIFGAYGSLGFSTLHKDNLTYEYYTSSYQTRRTLARPYFSYGFGSSLDWYIDPDKTFGIGLDISFSRMGFRDDIFDETFRIYYITVSPRLVSWTQKNFFVAGGFYWSLAISYAKQAAKERMNNLDYGLLLEWAFIQPSKTIMSRIGFKIFIGLKKVFKEWNEPLHRIGTPEGMTFTVHFYISFLFGIA